MPLAELEAALDRFETRCAALGVAVTPRGRAISRHEASELLWNRWRMRHPEIECLYSRWNGFDLVGNGSHYTVEGFTAFDHLNGALGYSKGFMDEMPYDRSVWSDSMFPIFQSEGSISAYSLRAFQRDDLTVYIQEMCGNYPVPIFPSLARAFDYFCESVSIEVAEEEGLPALEETEALGRRMFPDMPAWFGPPYPPVSSFLPR